MAAEVPHTLEYRGGQLNAAPLLEDFQDSLDDEDDTRSSQEYLNDLEEEYHARALLAKSKRFFKEDEEEVSSDDNEMVKVKILMKLADDNDAVSKKADESSVCSTPLPLLEKLAGAELVFGSKTIKSILKSNSTFKAETLKSVIINESSSAPTKVNKKASTSKINSAPAAQFIPQLITMTLSGSEECDIRKPIWYLDSGCSRHMTGVKSYMHKYVEQPGPKVVFRDDSTSITEGYGSFKCNDYLGKFNEKADDGYFLRYSLVSKAFRVFNTRKQQTEETYHITFDESTDAIKFTKPSVDNINIAKSERYLPDEYLYHYEPSQRYQNFKPTSSLAKDASVQNAIPILIVPSSSIPSIVSPVPQDRWSQDKHIELVNIIGDPRAGMLTTAMAKDLSAASAHECLFIDFLSEEETKKVSEALKHPGWVDAMQDELNQFARRKVWTLVVPYGKTTISLKWVFRNKRDETGIVIKNNARLVPKRKSTSVAAGCCANILWMKSQLTDYDIIYEKEYIFYDNTNHVLKGDIELHFIPTHYQLADIFTKPLDEPTFKRLIVELESSNPTEIPSSPKLTPKEEPGTQDRLESPNPFLPTDQVEFAFNEIIVSTNNEVSLLYLSHPKLEYFKVISDFITKCCLKEAFTRAPNQCKEYLYEFWYTAKTLEDYKIWVSIPTGGIKGDIGPLFMAHMLVICNANVPVDFKAPKTSSPAKRKVFKGKNLGASSGIKRKQSSKHTSESKTEASKSKNGHLDKENMSSSALDNNLSHASFPPWLTSFIVHSESALGCDDSADSTAKANPGLSAPNTTKSDGDGLKIVHTESGTNKDERSDFMNTNSNKDETIIVTDKSDEEEAERYEDAHATHHDEPEDTSVPHPPSPRSVQLQKLKDHVLLLKSQNLMLEQQKEKAEAEIAFLQAQPLYPNVNQFTELLVTSMKPKLSKLLSSHDFSRSIPTELKELPSKITELSREVKELNKHVQELEIELPGDLQDIPKKLVTFTSTISSLTTYVAELKTHQ
ncbi:hypothetical protein Tco_1533518 [Tanacetum coccineum]